MSTPRWRSGLSPWKRMPKGEMRRPSTGQRGMEQPPVSRPRLNRRRATLWVIPLKGCCRSGASRVTSATGPDARRGFEGIAVRYVEKPQRSRWPRAAEPSGLSRGRFPMNLRETAERSAGETQRAQGGCGAIRRQNSSPMLQHRIRRPSLSGTRKTPVRGRTPLLQHPYRKPGRSPPRPKSSRRMTRRVSPSRTSDSPSGSTARPWARPWPRTRPEV